MIRNAEQLYSTVAKINIHVTEDTFDICENFSRLFRLFCARFLHLAFRLERFGKETLKYYFWVV